jgi:hypothetical protein
MVPPKTINAAVGLIRADMLPPSMVKARIREPIAIIIPKTVVAPTNKPLPCHKLWF